MAQAKLIDAGIDYARITTQDEGRKRELAEMFRKVLVEDQKLGYKAQTGGAFGFTGAKCRHALMGDKKEWRMLQMSGRFAKRALFAAREGTQASRIDLQLTYEVGEENVERVIREAYKGACVVDRPEARHMKVNMIESRGKAQTVYIGSRASDIFFRIYDKFEESKKPEYKGCVRFELELKGRASKAIWRELVLHKTSLLEMLQMVVAMLKERGVLVPCEDIQEQDIKLPPKEPTSMDGTVAWLARQVGPTVKRLTGEYGWVYPFSVLFDNALPEFRRRRVYHQLALNWGS